MTILNASIDWITASKKSSWGNLEYVSNVQEAGMIAWRIANELGFMDSHIKFKSKERFYPWVFTAEPSGIEIGVGQSLLEQGVVFRATGKVCNRLSNADATMAILKDKFWKVTRLDIAFDVIGQPYNFERVEQAARELANTTRRKFAAEIGVNGSTVYVGSRESENMLRMYDKGRQQRVDYPWLRVELEIKGDVAETLGKRDAPVSRHALWHMSRWCEHLNLWVVGEMDKYLANFQSFKVSRKEINSDRAVWMNTTVVAAFRKWLDDEPEKAVEWVELLKNLIDVKEELDI